MPDARLKELLGSLSRDRAAPAGGDAIVVDQADEAPDQVAERLAAGL